MYDINNNEFCVNCQIRQICQHLCKMFTNRVKVYEKSLSTTKSLPTRKCLTFTERLVTKKQFDKNIISIVIFVLKIKQLLVIIFFRPIQIKFNV